VRELSNGRSSSDCQHGSPQVAVRQGKWKLLVEDAKSYVFDLSTDLGERNDLTSVRQDVARRLRPLIAAWEKDVDAEAKLLAPPLPPQTADR
jgi:hypothetical protein